ncbi:hypothetical protein B0H19DRAFT_368553 [Mycena capillaripes]|nr:hypothetical protein B0H19DRAFT_368553 [Mycena capillaripes]
MLLLHQTFWFPNLIFDIACRTSSNGQLPSSDTPTFFSAMPPVRGTKTLELSENLCKAIQLQDRLGIYKNLEHVIHQLVDRYFDLSLPSYQQDSAMESFVNNIIKSFTGYFQKSHPNEEERVICLRAYVASYLDENVVKISGKAKAIKEPQSFDASPEGHIIKCARPKPRPLYASHKKKRAVVEETIPSPLLDALADDADPLEVDESEYYPTNGGKRHVSFTVASPEPSPTPPPEPDHAPSPSPPPEPNHAPSPSPPPEPDYAPSPSPEAAIPTHPIMDFLENCYPQMTSRAEAFERAGIVKKEHLVGMARWSDETLKSFLINNDVASTPLEAEALTIGFSCILSESFA